MNRALRFLLAGSLLAFACGPRPPSAVWVVRTAIATPEGAAAAAEQVSDARFDTAVVQVRGRGDAYYRSELVPRAEEMAGAPAGFDPLSQMLLDLQGRRVLAWMNVFFLWSGDAPPGDPAHAATAHPEWLLTDADGRPVAEYTAAERSRGWIEGIYADPASPGYREHFCRAVSELVARYPVDGVHLDFVRYPGPGYGQAGEVRQRFLETWGIDPRWIPEELRVPDLAAWATGTMPPADRVLATAALLWADVRASRVTALVEDVRRTLDEVRPGLELSAAVFPDAGPAYVEKGQDWRAWADRGLVDALYPMAYFGGEERVGAQLRAFREALGPAAARVRLWAGLGAYRKEPEQIGREARLAREAGYDGVCLFDLGTLAAGPSGLEPYARAVGRRAGAGAPVAPAPAFPSGRTTGGRWLAASLERASGGAPIPGVNLEEVIEARWAEFDGARGEALPRVLARLGASPVRTPARVSLRGIFRYVHPLDGEARREEQQAACHEARARVLGGEPFEAVAGEVSQAGSRSQGGVIGPRFLSPGSPANDLLLATAAGSVTPVIAVENGCWVYRVEASEAPREVRFSDAPWELRRILLRSALSAELGKLAAAGSRLASTGRPDAEEAR